MRTPATAGGRRVARPRSRRVYVLRLLLFTLVMLPLLVWVPLPVLLVFKVLETVPSAIPQDTSGLPFPVEAVSWHSPNGPVQRGWFGHTSATAPVILLGHGKDGNRLAMVPYGDFLYHAGYNVLLLDWRGWGASEGSRFTFGLHESEDISAALDYLSTRPDLDHPRFGGLGISLGSGMMMVSAARDHRLAAIVCDSIYTYPVIAASIEAWTSPGLAIGGWHVPVLPLGLPTANLLLDGQMGALDPIVQAAHLNPTALLLIHAVGDSYPLTPVSGARAVFAAASSPKDLWISPVGDHTTTIFADPPGYQQHVLSFVATYLPIQP